MNPERERSSVWGEIVFEQPTVYLNPTHDQSVQKQSMVSPKSNACWRWASRLMVSWCSRPVLQKTTLISSGSLWSYAWRMFQSMNPDDLPPEKLMTAGPSSLYGLVIDAPDSLQCMHQPRCACLSCSFSRILGGYVHPPGLESSEAASGCSH